METYCYILKRHNNLVSIHRLPEVHSHRPIAFGSHPSSTLHPATSTLHQHQDTTSQRFFHMQHQPAPVHHQPAPVHHQPAPVFHQPAPAPHQPIFQKPVHQPVHQTIFQKPVVQHPDPNYGQPPKGPPSIGGKGIVPKVT